MPGTDDACGWIFALFLHENIRILPKKLEILVVS